MPATRCHTARHLLPLLAAFLPSCEDARPSDSPPACDFTHVESAAPAALGTNARSFAVGGFTLARDADGGLSVTHRDAPDRVLFALPDAASVQALRATVTADESQGSFAVHETIDAACPFSPAGATARHDGANLLLDGAAAPGEACDGLTWQVRACEPLPHHLSLEIRVRGAVGPLAVRFQAASDAGERVFGLGEQFPRDTLDHKGRVVPVLVQEQGIGRGEPSIAAVMEVLSPGSSGNETTTHHPVPHVLTSRARSFLLENTQYTVFDLASPDAIDVRVHAPDARIRVLSGRDPLELIERLTAFTGRMRPPPAWLDDGAILAVARPPQEAPAIVDALLDRGAPLSAVWTQTWCGTAVTVLGEQVLWNWVARPGWDGYVDALAQRGVRPLCYVNPMFRDLPPEAPEGTRNLYREAVDGGFAVRTVDGAPYLLKQGVFDVALLDLSSPAARDWMRAVLVDEMLGAGCAGWMADFAEALPFDAVLASGEDAAAWHNRYPVEWARLNREALEAAGMLDEALVFHRSGFTTTPAFSGMQWHGDQTVTWDRYDGLASALHGLLNGGFSGISLNHSDAGGYTVVPLVDPPVARTPELLMRWVEMNAFTAVLRTHEGNQPAVNAQVWSDDATADHFARFAQVYRGLAPIRRPLFDEAAQRGWPVVRHLAMHHPDVPRAWQVHDQFLLGPDVLVAPILTPCADPDECVVTRSVWLPPGTWVHAWSGTSHTAGEGGLDLDVAAPLGAPPVFVRQGSPAADVIATIAAELDD